MAYFGLKHSLFPLLRQRIKQINGLENIPTSGPFIIASNHLSIFDPPILISILFPLIKKKIHFVTGPRLSKLFKLLHLDDTLGIIPIDKNNKEKCLYHTLDHLENDKVCLIFPEGKRSRSENLREAKTGIARLALWTKLPILPIGIFHPSAKNLFEEFKNFFSRKELKISIGKPITFERYYSEEINPVRRDETLDPTLSEYKESGLSLSPSQKAGLSNGVNKDLLKKITKEIMISISNLSGKFYPY